MLEFWSLIFWIGAAALLAYLSFELGRMTRVQPETAGPADNHKPKPEPEVQEPKPKPKPELPTESYPVWFREWVNYPHLGVTPQNIDDLYEWAITVSQVAFVEFGGGVSAKHHLYRWLKAEEAYDHVPAKWKSLHALERLQQAWRRAGLVELHSHQKGLELTEAGINALQADPERWYP